MIIVSCLHNFPKSNIIQLVRARHVSGALDFSLHRESLTSMCWPKDDTRELNFILMDRHASREVEDLIKAASR